MTTLRYGVGARPLAIAHRGGAGLAAENTLDAFGRSYALGVRYLETDVRMSADGVCMAFHDATLRRVLGRPGRVRDVTRRALARHDIPTLADVLTAFPDAYITVDVKEAAAVAPLARTLRATNAARRVCAAGAWDGWLGRLAAETGPELTTALGWRALCSLLTGTPRYVRPGTFAHLPARLFRRPSTLLARAHAAHLRVIAWTVNESTEMHRLLDAGLDGIITDRPDLLRDVLIARDAWVPPYVTVSDRDS